MGEKGIPLGLLTSTLLTCVLVYRRNLSSWTEVLEAELGIFAAKNFLGAAFSGFTVWVLHMWIRPPSTALENFLYLCVLCGAGSVVFAGVLFASGAFTISQVASVWQQPHDS